MDLQKIKFRVRQFNPEIDKYEDLVELDRKIFKLKHESMEQTKSYTNNATG
jgi:hypothetical protein